MLTDLPTDQVILRADARAINSDAVSALVNSIGAVGLINPIRVRASGDSYELIAGAHRLEACKQLGLVEVPCVVVTDDDLHAELAMIDENLCRADLSPSDRAKQTARRKAIYLEIHPETAQGKANAKEIQSLDVSDRAPAFVDSTAAMTGRSRSAVAADVDRGRKVIDEVVDLIRGTKLDTGTYLDRIKNLPPNEQVAAAQRDLARLRSQEREANKSSTRSKIDADVKSRAAKEVAEMLAEHVPGDWWDALKANLYAAGAANIANEFTNATGQSIMDRRYA